MQKWEYITVHANVKRDSEVVETVDGKKIQPVALDVYLNNLGNQSWEVVEIVRGVYTYYYTMGILLKRPKE